jgi:hypothetical protein
MYPPPAQQAAQPGTAAPPQPAQAAAVSPLEAWFDTTLRPVLLQHLAAADGQAVAAAETRHKQTLAAFEHWLTTLNPRYATWTPETRDAVTALASEVRGLLDSVGGF